MALTPGDADAAVVKAGKKAEKNQTKGLEIRNLRVQLKKALEGVVPCLERNRSHPNKRA